MGAARTRCGGCVVSIGACRSATNASASGCGAVACVACSLALPSDPCLSRRCEDASFMIYIGTGSIPRISFVHNIGGMRPAFVEPAVVPVVAVS